MNYFNCMITVAIVEDNLRAGALLKEFIESDEIHVVANYNSAEQALEQIPGLPLPDIALVDIGLPGMSGIELTEKLKSRFPRLEIIIQTIFEDETVIVDAIKAGASGYILKASTREEILWALREVTNGGSYLSGIVARKILDELKTDKKAPSSNIVSSLTSREQEILEKLIAGSSYKAIASSLNLSVHTVNSHIRSIYEKLQVTTRGEAAAKMMNFKK